MKSLKDWQNEIGEWAKRKGWDIDSDKIERKLLLMHSEISEATEEFREGREPNEVWENWDRALKKAPIKTEGDSVSQVQMLPKPEGIPIELADLVIRVLHFCHDNNINLDQMIELKMEYNRLRPYRHGGLKA